MPMQKLLTISAFTHLFSVGIMFDNLYFFCIDICRQLIVFPPFLSTLYCMFSDVLPPWYLHTSHNVYTTIIRGIYTHLTMFTQLSYVVSTHISQCLHNYHTWYLHTSYNVYTAIIRGIYTHLTMFTQLSYVVSTHISQCLHNYHTSMPVIYSI